MLRTFPINQVNLCAGLLTAAPFPDLACQAVCEYNSLMAFLYKGQLCKFALHYGFSKKVYSYFQTRCYLLLIMLRKVTLQFWKQK